MMSGTLGIYIHVPFCAKKCPYCNFYSLPYSRRLTDLFTEAAMRNIKYYSDKERIVDTVYFGGGTPSLLSPEQIGGMTEQIKDSFPLDGNAEITLEANPNTVNREKLRKLREAGVNRISFGVQSFNEERLRMLGRLHTPESAVKAVTDAADAGFSNISCDFMTALPGMDTDEPEEFAKKISELPVNHVSAYILKIEDGTPFAGSTVADTLPNDDKTADIYLETVKALENIGLKQYEISNFAVPGSESRHNMRYWKLRDYIGIGPSAHSCFDGKRFFADCSLEEFIKNDIQPVTVTEESPGDLTEQVMLRLRLREGLDLSTTGEYRQTIEKKIPNIVRAGYAEYDGNILSLTPNGFLVSNSVISYLLF